MVPAVQEDALLPSGLVALTHMPWCPVPGIYQSFCANGAPAELVWHTAAPSEVEPAALCLGEMQKILGQAKGKVKQTIYFQAEQSDVSVSV